MKKIIKEITPIKKKVENAPTKKRVAAYARVSTDQDEQFASYVAQIDYYTKYIKANDEWELVQAELELNNQVRSHGNNVLCGRVICTDCGSIYGPKVWRSNDIYRYVVWQCNNKFNGTKCTTPTLDEETIKNAYLKALNILLKDKELLISNLLLVKENY